VRHSGHSRRRPCAFKSPRGAPCGGPRGGGHRLRLSGVHNFNFNFNFNFNAGCRPSTCDTALLRRCPLLQVTALHLLEPRLLRAKQKGVIRTRKASTADPAHAAVRRHRTQYRITARCLSYRAPAACCVDEYDKSTASHGDERTVQ
jgi:hypothetical protein